MRLTRKTLAAAVLALLPAAAQARASASLAARRRALQADDRHLLEIAPEADALDIPEADRRRLGPQELAALQSRYEAKRFEAARLAKTLGAPMRAEDLEAQETRFPALRSELLSLLFQLSSSRYFGDKDRFVQQKQDELDIRVAQERRKALRRGAARVTAYESRLGAIPDRATLERLYDRVGARTVLSQTAVAGGARGGPAAAALAGLQIAQFKPSPAWGVLAVPPEPQVVPASFSPAPAASSSLLSRLIGSETVRSARRYAGKVADAIVGFSRRYGIDEKLQTAVIWAESQFDPRAVSYAGARGLGQLMPGTAAGLGVRNAYDIDQNVRGSAQFVRDLLAHFSTPDEQRYMAGLYAWGKTQVEAGRPVEQVWSEVFSRTPLGIKNAIAAYNAGSGAIDSYAHGDYRRLPVRRTAAAERAGLGYWQTIHYVPKVLRNYFEVVLRATPSRQPALLMTSNEAPAASTRPANG